MSAPSNEGLHSRDFVRILVQNSLRMTSNLARGCVVLAAAAWIAAGLTRVQAEAQSAPSQKPTIDYERQIRPIIRANCLACHNAEKRKGGLSLASYEDVLEGGRSGAIVRPGRGHDSLVMRRMSGDVEPQMPLGEAPLIPSELAIIRAWIDEGARRTATSPPAPAPWDAPLALERPAVPAAVWPAWSAPIDRFTAAYLATTAPAAARRLAPTVVSDPLFARRAYLDVWGLLPTPEELQAFLRDTRVDKRARLVEALLADDQKYADHWMSFWNDLLRNEDGVTYFSDAAGGARRSITPWLLDALRTNLPYDRFVTKLLSPSGAGDPDGFLIGVNWRGETSAAVTPWMQASQSTAQVFLGVNMKCNACHDSFVSRWSLKDAYGLAAFFSPEPRLQLFRCDVARNEYAEPRFPFPEVSRTPASSSLADRRAAAAAMFTDRRNGRMPRTIVNRIWERLLGHGLVPQSDEMDRKPWSPALLDWVAAEFVEQGYDLRWLVATIITSRTYQMPAVGRTDDAAARDYVFAGPEVRRLTAEQFADAIGRMTGEWSVLPGGGRGEAPRPPAGRGAGPRTGTDALTNGTYGRNWRAPSSSLTRALGRPIRDQVVSSRAKDATTPQALELVNGEALTRWLLRGAERLTGELPEEPLSLWNGAVAGGNATPRSFEVNIANAQRVWLLVTDTGSNAPERVLPLWSGVEFVTAAGAVTPLRELTPAESAGERRTTRGIEVPGSLPVSGTSRLVYDIAGRGFVTLRGQLALENPAIEIGSTLNPSLRFFVFDRAPNLARLLPAWHELPLASPPVVRTAGAVVDRLYRHALQRPPTAAERKIAEAAIRDPRRPGRVSAEAVADLLWAIMMTPEFQLIV